MMVLSLLWERAQFECAEQSLMLECNVSFAGLMQEIEDHLECHQEKYLLPNSFDGSHESLPLVYLQTHCRQVECVFKSSHVTKNVFYRFIKVYFYD
jgi:hypothetical protein